MAAAPALTPAPTAHPRPQTAPAPRPAPHDERARPGKLLAVCGTCPGAGASLLACLVALAVAHQRGEHLLVCDLGDLGAAIARPDGLTAVGSLLTLHGDARLPAAVPAAGHDRAAEPMACAHQSAGAPRVGLAGLIDRARTANSLTVIDCGILSRRAERHQIACADTVLWVLPATPDGLANARRAVQRLRTGPREIVVARAAPTRRGSRWRGRFIAPQRTADDPPPVAEIRRLAAQRGAPLILSPWLPPTAAARPRAALETLQIPLQAILGALAR